MALGNLGRVLAGQAVETAKKNVLDSILPPDAPKAQEKTAQEKPAAPAVDSVGAVILGQIQGMQRSLRDDQELVIFASAAGESLKVRIFLSRRLTLSRIGAAKRVRNSSRFLLVGPSGRPPLGNRGPPNTGRPLAFLRIKAWARLTISMVRR